MGKQWKHTSDFIFLGSKITADGNCSHEIKRHSLLGRKVMTNLDIIFKSRDIALSTKVCLVKAVVFPVVMYGCESWTRKKAERQRIDAFELWCWRRLLRVLWTARRSNQSILKDIHPGYSLEGLMLKLKLQYFDHLMRGADFFEKTLMLGEIKGKRRRGWQRMRMVGWYHWLNGHEFGWTPGVGDGQGGLVCCSPWGHKESDTIHRLHWTKLGMNMNFYLEEERKSQQSVVGSWEEEAAPSSAHLVVLITLSGDAMGKWGQQTVFSWEWVPPNTSGSLYGKTVSHRGRLHFPFRSDCLKHASICPPKF